MTAFVRLALIKKPAGSVFLQYFYQYGDRKTGFSRAVSADRQEPSPLFLRSVNKIPCGRKAPFRFRRTGNETVETCVLIPFVDIRKREAPEVPVPPPVPHRKRGGGFLFLIGRRIILFPYTRRARRG
jgi:hypothetical protein